MKAQLKKKDSKVINAIKRENESKKGGEIATAILALSLITLVLLLIRIMFYPAPKPRPRPGLKSESIVVQSVQKEDGRYTLTPLFERNGCIVYRVQQEGSKQSELVAIPGTRFDYDR